MHATLTTIAFRGIDTVEVSVQIHLANGLPAMRIVGLADKAVAESRERVRAALASMGLALPAKRIAVNLSPADLAKEGAHYDLPIALALMVAMGVLPSDCLDDAVVLGELSLDGQLLPVAGALPAAIFAASRNMCLICPQANGKEAAWAGNLDVIAAPHLSSLLGHLRGQHILPPPVAELQPETRAVFDMADIKGQETAKRALEIAAAGGHHLLMIGPPGAGKSMLAARLPGLLPPLTPAEALDVTMIHSVAGHVPSEGLIQHRPFRDPHHSASMAALIGGGQKVQPGEISLAHHGVLFLDELAEFQRPVLDSLRQPLETGEVVIARAQTHIRFPSEFQLIAAMNPCRCGYPTDPARHCGRRVSECVKQYLSRISGPMLDRFDMIIDVSELDAALLMTPADGEPTEVIAKRIRAAREHARSLSSSEGVRLNARLKADQLERLKLSADARRLLDESLSTRLLSARAFHKMLRVACTIRDLAHGEEISELHVAEALHYRQRELLA